MPTNIACKFERANNFYLIFTVTYWHIFKDGIPTPNLLHQTSTSHDSTKNPHGISKFKSNASQCYATLATNMIKLTSGSMGGFTAVLVAELYKDNAEIHMSVDDVTWFSSHYFMKPVGSLLFGIVAHNIGNRPTMLVASFFYIVACLTFYWASNATMLLTVQALIGLVLPISSGAGNAYVVEIAEPHLRSTLTACTSLSIIFAGFLIVLLSNFLHWRVIALVILVFPIAGCVAMCTVPESPHWLASKGKLDKAKLALSWVRGWTSPNNVIPEFNQIKEAYKNSSPESERNCKIEDTSNLKSTSYLKNILNPYSQRSFYIPLASICCMFVLKDCAGYHALTTFFIVIFREMNSPIDPHVAGTLNDAARFLGAIIFMLSVNRTGKKKLVYFSLVVATLSYFTISTVLLLKYHGANAVVCSWITAITMILSTFATSVGLDKILYILNAELFPTEFRNIGSGIGLFVFFVTGSISNKLFIYALNVLTLPGIFVVYGIACILNCVIFYVMIPETEGRTLKEIEEHYNGVKRLKD